MPKTLLIFHFGDLGDTILTVPAHRALRAHYSDARLVLMAKPGPASYVSRLGLVDAIIPADKHVFDRIRGLLNPSAQLALLTLLWRLRREKADSVVIFGHLVTAFGAMKYALLSLATGATHRYGLDNGRGWFLTSKAEDQGFGVKHEADYWLEVAGLLGTSGPLSLDAPITGSDRMAAARLLDTQGADVRPVVAIHPSTGWYGPGRKWDPIRFGEVCELLSSQTDVRFAIVGTEDDRQDADRMLSGVHLPILDLVGRTSVGELAAVLQRCALLIANDSGVGHLAAAVGIQVISIFGPSNDDAYRPLTAKVVSVDLPCRPCLYRDFERGLPTGCESRRCMELVTPSMVAAAARRVLAGQEIGVI